MEGLALLLQHLRLRIHRVQIVTALTNAHRQTQHSGKKQLSAGPAAHSCSLLQPRLEQALAETHRDRLLNVRSKNTHRPSENPVSTVLSPSPASPALLFPLFADLVISVISSACRYIRGHSGRRRANELHAHSARSCRARSSLCSRTCTLAMRSSSAERLMAGGGGVEGVGGEGRGERKGGTAQSQPEPRPLDLLRSRPIRRVRRMRGTLGDARWRHARGNTRARCATGSWHSRRRLRSIGVARP